MKVVRVRNFRHDSNYLNNTYLLHAVPFSFLNGFSTLLDPCETLCFTTTDSEQEKRGFIVTRRGSRPKEVKRKRPHSSCYKFPPTLFNHFLYSLLLTVNLYGLGHYKDTVPVNENHRPTAKNSLPEVKKDVREVLRERRCFLSRIKDELSNMTPQTLDPFFVVLPCYLSESATFVSTTHI